MQAILDIIKDYLTNIYIPKTLHATNIIEIIILTFVLYEFMAWVKKTRAYSLLKGILILLLFWLIAYIFNFTTILWLGSKVLNIAIIALVVIFQPELRKALESLGQRNRLSKILPFTEKKDKADRFSNQTIEELVRASFQLAKAKTGALIVIEQEILVTEYEKTGIAIDAIVTSSLLINMFEKNTPLHDGAAIIRGDRIVAATCYLPMSDNMRISKELGTRHRAALGISEVSDSLTIVVSEETGKVSLAIGGELFRDIDGDYLRNKLTFIQKRTLDVKRFRLWKKGGKSDGQSQDGHSDKSSKKSER